MSSTSLSTIQSRLSELFAPQEECEPAAGRVVVWFDPEGEFAELLDQLDLPDVELLVEEPNQLFELKRRVNARAVGQNMLLYRRRPRGELAGNWLADVELYATPFQADGTSMLMADLGAQDAPQLRSAVMGLRKFLAKKTNLKRVKALLPTLTKPQELYRAVMAAALGAAEASWTAVLIAYLVNSREDGRAEAIESLEQAGVWEHFCDMVVKQTGYKADPRNTFELQKHVLLTALASNGCLVGALGDLKASVSSNHTGTCLTLVHEWMRAESKDVRVALYEACREIEEGCGLPRRLSGVAVDDLVSSDAFPCINECILRACMRPVGQGGLRPDEVLRVCEQRKNFKWYKHVRAYFEGVAAYARMEQFYAAHNAGFHEPTAVAYWERYTDRAGGWWRMDREYRRFRMAVVETSERPTPEVDDEFKALAQTVERLYRGWFLKELGAGWCGAVQEDLRGQGYAGGIERQAHFFMNRVTSLTKGKSPAYVVVSDALRYEVACDLADRLEQETKGVAELGGMQAVFPTETPYGMAALLPHGAYDLKVDGGRADVRCGGLPTTGTDARQKVLDARYPGSVAVQYRDFITMQRTQRKELAAGAPVVYIYHDRVDATGEERATEHDVFRACERAVGELSGLVDLLRREGAQTVLITADHGFLYTAEPLPETDKVGVDEICGDVVLADRRSVLARLGATSPVLMEVNMHGNGSDDLVGFTPRGAVRLKRGGGVQNYMHGGVSLQEMCVPVLTYRNLKANSKGYVETTMAPIELVSSLTTVTNSLFNLDFFQKEPVGGKVTKATYEIFVAESPDAGSAPVSDVAKLEADKTSDVREERMIRVPMAIRGDAQTSSQKEYYLVVASVADSRRSVAWTRPLRIDIAFAVEDFGW